MASLVADYSDSSSDEEEINETVPVKKEPVEDSKQNFFSLSAAADSDDDSKDIKPVVKQIKEETGPASGSRLPNPLLSSSDSKEPVRLPSMKEATTSRIGTSVFVNPFEEAEQAKTSILEHHVRLTEATPKKPAHQPTCWKFKKGKCTMGKNCRFFHDPESVSIPPVSDTNEAATQSDSSNSSRQMYHPSVYRQSQYSRELAPEPIDEDNYMAGMKRKKRYGVNDHLVPPKKAFNALMEQRVKERPWTVNQHTGQGW